MEVKGEILTPLLGHFYDDKNDVSVQMLIFMFFIYISEIFFTISIYSPLTLTSLSAESSPSFPRTKWKCIITIPQPRLQENTKQQNSY